MTVNGNKKISCGMLLVFCSMALVACSKTVPATAEQRPEAPANETRTSTEAASSNKIAKSVEPTRGKPGAQISLATNEIHKAKAGIASDIKLVLITPYIEGQLTVAVSASEGLALVSEVNEFTFMLDADTDYAIPLQILAQEDGRYYVHMQVNLEVEGRRTFRALSAIIQVGQDEQPKKAELKVRTTGEASPVILLPAEETIVND